MKCHSRGEQKWGYFSLDPQILLITVPSLRWFWVHLQRLLSTERGNGGCPRPCLPLEKCMSGVMLDQASHLPLGPHSWNSLLFPSTFATAAAGSSSCLAGVGSALEEGDVVWGSMVPAASPGLTEPVSWARAALSQLPFSEYCSGRKQSPPAAGMRSAQSHPGEAPVSCLYPGRGPVLGCWVLRDRGLAFLQGWLPGDPSCSGFPRSRKLRVCAGVWWA